jgi:hypothetical protein
MPDHWDTKPENLFSVPDRQPDPVPNEGHDQTNEIRLNTFAPRGATSGCGRAVCSG